MDRTLIKFITLSAAYLALGNTVAAVPLSPAGPVGAKATVPVAQSAPGPATRNRKRGA